MVHVLNEKLTYSWRNKKFPLVIDHPDHDSDVVLILGHGLNNDMNDELLHYLANTLVREGLTVVRFNYPFATKRWKVYLPNPQKWLLLYQIVLDHVKNLSFIPKNAYFFTGGKSLSALVSALLFEEQEVGKIFLGAPLEIRKLFFPLAIDTTIFDNSKVPMLFIQGGKDPFAPRKKLELLMGKLNPLGHLLLIPEGDHSLRIASKTDRMQTELYQEVSDIILWFISECLQKKIKKEETTN